MTPDNRVSQDRGAPPKCECRFQDRCNPASQAIAQRLHVAGRDCLLYEGQMVHTNPTSREDIRTPF